LSKSSSSDPPLASHRLPKENGFRSSSSGKFVSMINCQLLPFG